MSMNPNVFWQHTGEILGLIIGFVLVALLGAAVGIIMLFIYEPDNSRGVQDSTSIVTTIVPNLTGILR